MCPIYLFIRLWMYLFLINSKGIFKKFLYRKLFHWFILTKGSQTITWEKKGKSQVFLGDRNGLVPRTSWETRTIRQPLRSPAHPSLPLSTALCLQFPALKHLEFSLTPGKANSSA